MQRLLTLVFLLGLAIPAGISISGCTRNPAGNYCNGEGFGPKLTDVASIDLEPRTTGISLAFGQTQQIAAPTAKTCKGAAASVSSYTYGTTNNQLVDISPTGNICAGTWNRRSGGGIPDFTICNFPSPLPSTGGLPYASAFVTATGQGISSNQVTVYTHAQVTGVSLVLEQPGTTKPQTGCLSQTATAQLDSQAFFAGVNGNTTLLCSPTPPQGVSVPSCSTALGNLTYAAQNSTIATIDTTGVITAQLPGTTYITATVAGASSPAGYFSTCPPAKISVTLNNATSGTVTQGVTQNLTTTITDTKGQTIQGLSLDYQSTNPLMISAGSTGAVTANFAGQASIYAVCQPTTCNPSPIDQVGVNLTGTPITSNEVQITTPGTASSFVWFANPVSPAAPGLDPLPGLPVSNGSLYFIPVELITGTVGSTVKMPYVPNSMVMDRTGTNLYFGSSHELMIYATVGNTLSKEDTSVPGVVLAVAPNNQTLLINDPILRRLSLYAPSSGASVNYGGQVVASSAQWTPDSKTLYVVGKDYSKDASNPVPTLFVYNANTTWTSYPLSTVSSDLAITIPSVGAFLSGQTTAAHAWCPAVTPSADGTTSTLNAAYPAAATVNAQTDILAATADGLHILGATLAGGTKPTLSDISVNVSSSSPSLNAGACPSSGGATQPITFSPTFVTANPSFSASSINQILPAPSSGSNLNFITYSPVDGASTAATLPYYLTNPDGSKGTTQSVTLTTTPAGTPTAPVTGAFSLDDTLFFVSTSGDNLVHYINVKSLTDTQQINPGLIDVTGASVPATAIAVKPRPTT